MKNKAIQRVKDCIVLLASHGEHEMASDLLCALAGLTGLEMPRPDLTYTSVMRELRANHKDKVKLFEKTFKEAFDESLDAELESPEQIALMQAIKAIDVEL